MGWKDWFSDGTGEKMREKSSTTNDGGRKDEQLRTNNGSKYDHQHSYQKYDSSNNLTGGGATPGKSKDDYDRQQKK